MIIRNPKELMERYDRLTTGDIFIGTISSAHLKKTIFIDLLERGVYCFPSPLSQMLNSSKTAQATLLKEWMLPNTRVITRRADLIESGNQYHREGITSVVTKEDRMHCGHGIRKWDSIELLYNVTSMVEPAYPFVLQPFSDRFTDVRIIISGNMIDAYVRNNPDNFRQNLSVGGTSAPYRMDRKMQLFCRSAMERGKFPYAHIDIQVTGDGAFYLSEIALNGGMAGSRLDRKELDRRKQAILEKLAKKAQKEKGGSTK